MREITRRTNIFEYTDKAVKLCLVRILRRFRKLRRTITAFDDTNVLKEVDSCYADVLEYTLTYLRLIAKYSYSLVDPEGDFLEEFWLANYLRDYNPVTKYSFYDEEDRKRARLIEALFASKTTKGGNPGKEIDRALNLWVRQFEQYADNVTVDAINQAYEDNGVRQVMWVTQKDEKVCSECRELDGKIFPIDDKPSLQHYNCRCHYIPVG